MHQLHLSLNSVMKLMVRKVKGCEIGEHNLWPFFILKQVHSVLRNSWCNPQMQFLVCYVGRKKKKTQQPIFRMCSHLMNYTFTTYYSQPAMQTIVGHLTRILKSWCESQLCLPPVSFACEPFQLINLKKMYQSQRFGVRFPKLCFQRALALLN